RSGVRPTAPLYVKAAPGSKALPGTYAVPLSPAPSVVAGSPGAIIPGYTALKTFGNSVPRWPFAISASPDSGPEENMYVWLHLPIVSQPSPPETRWHLIAPFTGPVGDTPYPRGPELDGGGQS